MIFLLSFSVFAQNNHDNNDSHAWSYFKVEGQLESSENPNSWTNNMLGAFEYHYRLNENMSTFQTMILRPMIGYQLENQAKIFVGYAYVEKNSPNGIIVENRIFQMMTYHSDSSKPVVFLGRTKIEETFLENSEKISLRFRQMLGVAISLFKIKETSVHAYLSNEYFIKNNFNDPGFKFNQNRARLGVSVKTQIGARPVQFKADYLNIISPEGGVSHGFSVGAYIYINRKKKK